MKSIVLTAVLTAAFASSAAMADGFLCQTTDGSLNIKVFNHTNAEVGTRRPAVIVLSAPDVGASRKTIARLTQVRSVSEAGTLTFSAPVDLEEPENGRPGEYILGTRLGQVKKVDVMVEFSYAEPMQEGELTEGAIVLTKHNGEIVDADAICERYLAGQ